MLSYTNIIQGGGRWRVLLASLSFWNLYRKMLRPPPTHTHILHIHCVFFCWVVPVECGKGVVYVWFKMHAMPAQWKYIIRRSWEHLVSERVRQPAQTPTFSIWKRLNEIQSTFRKQRSTPVRSRINLLLATLQQEDASRWHSWARAKDVKLPAHSRGMMAEEDCRNFLGIQGYTTVP